MTHIISSLCLRDAGCVDVCPVECIVPGKPVEEWPWYYIDPDTCIDCGACIPECPYEAIFTEEETPTDFTAQGGSSTWRSDLRSPREAVVVDYACRIASSARGSAATAGCARCIQPNRGNRVNRANSAT